MNNHIEKSLIKNLVQLIKFSINAKKLAIAVSGGVDSVAVLIIVSRWAKANNIQIIVLTVNHNVRKESRVECEYVKNLSNKLGHECHILQWYPGENPSNFQERARNARYDLMTELCNKNGVDILVTGHHCGDLLEDYFFRTSKKGKLLGHSTNNLRYYNNIRVIKPAFNIEKKNLKNFLISQKVDWYEDISNYSDKYTRNKIRNNLIEEGDSFKNKNLRLMNKKNIEAKNSHQELVQAIAEAVAINNYGFAKINTTILKKFSLDTQLNVINYILTIIGGHIKIPRSKSSSLIIELLLKPQDFTKTLHNCILERNSEQLIIYYELGKNSSAINKRFTYSNVDLVKDIEGLHITRLNIKDYVAIKNKIDLQNLKTIAGKCYKKILFTLPVIKILEKVVAIPHISYYDHNIFEQDYFIFSPKFISRFTHFC